MVSSGVLLFTTRGFFNQHRNTSISCYSFHPRRNADAVAGIRTRNLGQTSVRRVVSGVVLETMPECSRLITRHKRGLQAFRSRSLEGRRQRELAQAPGPDSTAHRCHQNDATTLGPNVDTHHAFVCTCRVTVDTPLLTTKNKNGGRQGQATKHECNARRKSHKTGVASARTHFTVAVHAVMLLLNNAPIREKTFRVTNKALQHTEGVLHGR